MVVVTELVGGRELQVGDIYITPDNDKRICKIKQVSTSKPGKHGSAKNLVAANDILSDKRVEATFKDGDNKVIKIVNFDYQFRPIYEIDLAGVLVGYNEEGMGVQLAFSEFTYGKDALQADIDKYMKQGQSYVNDEGAQLCIKFSKMIDPPQLIYWGMEYIPIANLPSHGIHDY